MLLALAAPAAAHTAAPRRARARLLSRDPPRTYILLVKFVHAARYEKGRPFGAKSVSHN